MHWFDVDKKGLGQIINRRGKSFVALELLQNGWDQNVTSVDVRLERPTGSREVTITVEDDDPDGFDDLRHAFTLFAPTRKRANPSVRGRFNLGEKLVLALCHEAEIISTSGSVRFDARGRHRCRKQLPAGSRFIGRMRMTNDEQAACLETLARVYPPAGIETRVNGVALATRTPVVEFVMSLPTEVADDQGRLIRRQRKTAVRVFEPRDGDSGWLYELGIPIVETGDAFDVDVQQKVPLSLERDNVSSTYLRNVRTGVLNHTAAYLRTVEEATAPWVRDAVSDPRCDPDTVRRAVEARFGEKAVAYDPSDPEANKRAISKGYTVVHGGSLSAAEWNNVRDAKSLPPAGRVTPSPKPFSTDPNAPTLRLLPPDQWSTNERNRVAEIQHIAERLIGQRISVRIAIDPDWPFDACFGEGDMIVNRRRVGRHWFDGPLNESVLRLVIHELGHHFASDHLSSDYHDALCRLGARLALDNSWKELT